MMIELFIMAKNLSILKNLIKIMKKEKLKKFYTNVKITVRMKN